jgi:hypothetical protein
LAAIADTSLSGLRVTRELDRLIATRGKPTSIVSDNVLCWEWGGTVGQHVSVRELGVAAIDLSN